MKSNQEQLWQAYIDGELSAAECADFETTLSEDERRLLAADMRLERGIAEKLAEPVSCPDDLWARTRAQIESEEQRPENVVALSSNRRWMWWGATLAAAASLAFFLSSVIAPMRPASSPSIAMAAASVADLEARSETGPSLAAMWEYVRACGMDIDASSLDELTSGAHPMKAIGAATSHPNDEDVVEMFFECCGHPIKVLLAERGSAAAMMIGEAVGNENDIQATRTVGRYLIAIVAEHPGEPLTSLVADDGSH